MNDNNTMTFKTLYRKHEYDKKENHLWGFWHYTSVEGLKGIIREEDAKDKIIRFWFTRCDCLNDSSEGVYIIELFRRTCIKLLEEKVIDETFYNWVIDIEIPDEQFVHYPVPPRQDCNHYSMMDCVPCDAYICSFSLKKDSLDMWRYYSKGNGGYAINLFYNIFEDHEDYCIDDYDENREFSCIHSLKVIYDNEEKKKIIESIIIDTFAASKNSEKPEKETKNFIRYILKILQFKFKHECFSSEEEYRFVFYLPKEKPKELANKMPKVEYRSQNGMLIPYITVTARRHVMEVMTSPYNSSEIILKTTQDYLTSCGIKSKVYPSELPVRF